MKPIDMSKEPTCAKEHNPPLLGENVVTGPGNALQYVVVYISAGEQSAQPPSEPVRYDQKGCMYVPHILAMHTNQPLQIYTDDPFTHNIHPMPNAHRNGINRSPLAPAPIDTKWANPEFIEVKCNIHPWMHGYFAVLNPSLCGDGQRGNYSLKGLRPASITVTAWQEQYSTQSRRSQSAQTGAASVNFVFKVTPYLINACGLVNTDGVRGLEWQVWLALAESRASIGRR